MKVKFDIFCQILSDETLHINVLRYWAVQFHEASPALKASIHICRYSIKVLNITEVFHGQAQIGMFDQRQLYYQQGKISKKEFFLVLTFLQTKIILERPLIRETI